MASGKNYVCSVMEEMGYISVDLDKEVHSVIDEKTEDIFSAFEKPAKDAGIIIRNDDNSLNRRELGSLLFSDPDLLSKQESIVYPALTEKIKAFIKAHKDKKEVKGIILNATVLYKTPELLKKCDAIVYVHANWLKRFHRARRRDNIPELQILQRFTAQKNLLTQYQQTSKPIVVIKN